MKRATWLVVLAAAIVLLTLVAGAWVCSSASAATARYSEALLRQDAVAASASGFYPGPDDFANMRQELLAGANAGSLTPHVRVRRPFLSWPPAVLTVVSYDRYGRSHPRELTLQLVLTSSGWQVAVLGVAKRD
jgi:hypothetical protein